MDKNHPVKVLHIASGDLWAGAEVQLFTLASALRKHTGTIVHILLLNHGKLEQKLRDTGIDVTVIDEASLNSAQILRQMIKTVRAIQPDIIHTHRLKENILGSIAAWRCGHIPSLRTQHGAAEHPAAVYKLHKHIIFFLDWLCGRYYQRYIIAVAADLAEKLARKYPESHIKTIENGIDTDTLPATTSANNETGKRHYRVGIAGRLAPVKRVDLFIQAAVCLKQQHPELSVDFYIYGDGPLSNSLQQQVTAASADDYIHFEGHCDDMATALQTLDILLMTSDHEGLPMILLEAMYLKTAIIAHAVGGIPHLLDQGKCGILIHEHQPETFAEAIQQLITHPKQHQKLTQHAFDRVKQHYSSRQTAENYQRLYNQLVKISTSNEYSTD